MLDDLWTQLLTTFPGGRLALFVAGMSVAYIGVYVAAVAMFQLAHRRGWWARYLFEDGRPPPDKLMRRAYREVVRDSLPAPLMGVALFYLYDAVGMRYEAPLPGPLEILGQLALFILVEDTLFYWSHRLLHRPWWFRKVHAHHHRFKATRAIAVLFTHPVETLFNAVAMLAGPALLSTHVVTFWIWVALRMWETADAHSGFTLPISRPWAPMHAWHHRYVHGCYGSFFGLWDRLMGTDEGYRAWKTEQAKP
ncbi:MAG: sterol desaturase family protein [Alphaproteobacteria bacterium]|nr:sterol desaturase family protein [Alphaproteobacteria bacterium]